MNAGAHLARFVFGQNQFFPSASNFRGTMALSSSIPIAAVALRQNDPPLCYTSLPAVPLSSDKKTVNLAHVANGSFGDGSFKTTFLLFNFSQVPGNVQLSLFKDDGPPFPVTVSGYGTADTFSLSLAAGGSVFLETDGGGPLAAGSAQINTNTPVGACAIFSVFDAQERFQTEAGIGDSPLMTQATIPVEIGSGVDTAVAFFNPGGQRITMTLSLLDTEGGWAGLAKGPVLQARNHSAQFLSEIFRGLRNFRGSLAISASAGVAALTLRQNSQPLSYTTLPVREGISKGGEPAVRPLLLQKTSPVSATENTVVNMQLPTGYLLSGQVSGPGSVSQVFAEGANGEIVTGSFDNTGRYSIVLGTGTYKLTAVFWPTGGSLTGGYIMVRYSEPNPVQISGDTTRDITLPSVAMSNVSGTVSGLTKLPYPNNMRLAFNSTNGSIAARFSIGSDGKYQAQLPLGDYLTGLDCPYITSPGPPTSPPQFLEFFNMGSVNVAGSAVTADFAVPNIAKLSGKVQPTSFPPYGVGFSFSATDISAVQFRQLSPLQVPSTYSTGFDASGRYEILLGLARKYGVYLTAALYQGSEFVGSLVNPSPLAVVDFASESAYDFNPPQLPGAVTLSGRITDSNGRGVKDVSVYANTGSVNSAAHTAFFSNTVLTDVNGDFHLLVLSGKDYLLIFAPRPPKL
jgi:hypothetical protein